MMKLETPYYLIDEKRLLRNLKIIGHIRSVSGAKCVLALKCFAGWSVFELIRKYMDGTTSSSLYEARLGNEKFGKETHAYCVGYKKSEIQQLGKFAHKIIFNSISQLEAFYTYASKASIGLRINPGISYSHYDLADPVRKFSRLGVADKSAIKKALPRLDGFMFHFNCENANFKNFSLNLDYIGNKYRDILKYSKWVSLGGGLYFTRKDYPVEKFCVKIKEFSRKFDVQVYLEPGESVITGSAELISSVVDIVRNKIDIAVVDASTEAHMLDLLIYRINAKVDSPASGRFKYMIAGRSCLAGDVFGTYFFKNKLKPGSIIRFKDAGGYTMVKKNWFNGLNMPSIAIRRMNGKIEMSRKFNYKDFVGSLS
jgi:carboxynorspermidine decarboxylase